MAKLDELIQELCPNGVEYKTIEEVIQYEQPSKYIVKSTDYDDTFQTPVLTAGQTFILGYTNETEGIYGASKDNPVIIFDDFTTANKWVDFGFKVKSSAMKILSSKDNKYNIRYLYHIIQTIKYIPVDHSRQWIGTYSKFKIPVPPLEVQCEIVRILDNFTELTAELTARKKQYEYYRDELLTFDENIKADKLSNLVNFRNGKGHEKDISETGKYIVVNSKFISTEGKVCKYSDNQIVPLYKDEILMVMSDLPNGRALAKCYIVEEDNKYTLNQRIGAFTISTKEIIPKFLYYVLNRNRQLLRYDNGVDQTNLRKDDILKIAIPIPSLEQQERIVSILDRFDALCNDISIGLPAEIEARQKQYAYYRDKLLTFKEKTA